MRAPAVRLRPHHEGADQVLDVEKPPRGEETFSALCFELKLHHFGCADLDIGLALAVAARDVLEVGDVLEPALVCQLDERLERLALHGQRHVPRNEVRNHELREAGALALGGLALVAGACVLWRRRARPRRHAELGLNHEHVRVVQRVRLEEKEPLARPASPASGSFGAVHLGGEQREEGVWCV